MKMTEKAQVKFQHAAVPKTASRMENRDRYSQKKVNSARSHTGVNIDLAFKRCWQLQRLSGQKVTPWSYEHIVLFLIVCY